MVSISILLLLCLITESAGILDHDIDISSKLKWMSMQNGGSTFLKHWATWLILKGSAEVRIKAMNTNLS